MVSRAGSTSACNGHHDPYCRPVTTDRQLTRTSALSGSAKRAPCILHSCRRNWRDENPAGDHSPGGCFILCGCSAANYAAASTRRTDSLCCVAQTASGQRGGQQAATEELGGVADHHPAERGGKRGRRRHWDHFSGSAAAANCGGGFWAARTARWLPDEADCDDASRRRSRWWWWARVREIRANRASDWTRRPTTPNRGITGRRAVHH